MTQITCLPSRPFSAAALVFAGALTLAACGTGASPQDPAGDGLDPPPQETTTTAVDDAVANVGTGIPPLGTPDTALKTRDPSVPARLAVTDVRLGSHHGFDRLVFDLAGEGSPGWRIDYTEHPIQQGSGHPIPYEGVTALEVNLTGMAYPSELGIEVPEIGTVPGTGNITEVISASLFEGRSQFVVGLSDRLPYSVQILEDPQRVVIDVLHGSGVTPLGEPDTAPKSFHPATLSELMVTDVRMASHGRFDRLVLDLTGEGTPGWDIYYTTHPTHQVSGLPVDYRGAVALDVTLAGVTYPPELGLEDPRTGTIPGTGNITEIISTTHYESRSQLIIGLSDRLPYSVQVLEEPRRLVIDILHG
nr:hypothetical protein [Corynebacterium halotolerans]